MKPTILCSVAVSMTLVLAAAGSAASGNLQTITLSERPAYGQAYRPTLDDDGRVIFTEDFYDSGKFAVALRSFYEGNVTTILAPGTLVEAGGELIPSSGFSVIGTPANGIVYVHGHLRSPTLGEADGVWRVNESAVTKVFVKGDPLGPNEQWLSSGISLSAGGRLFFESSTRLPDGGYIPFRRGLWYADTDGILKVVQRSGDSLPGLEAGQASNYISSLSLSDRGDAAIMANYMDTASTQVLGQGLWLRDLTGNVRLAVKTGDAVEFNGQLVNLQLGTLATLNNAGQLVFGGTVEYKALSQYPIDTIWLQEADGRRRLVVSAGHGLPPIHENIAINRINYVGNWNPANLLNDGGEVAFAASFYRLNDAPSMPQELSQLQEGDDVGPVSPDDREGIWLDDHGDLNLVVQTGDTLPGVDKPLVSAEPLALNNAGQLLFRGATVDIYPNPAAAEYGIWIRNTNGVFNFIIGTGMQIDVAPGPEVDLRTVQYFATPTVSAPGESSSFNERGQVLLMVQFTDESRGIFVYDVSAVPESNISSMCAIAIVFALLRRNSR